MRHGGIARQGDGIDIVQRHSGLFDNAGDDLVHGGRHHLMESVQAPRFFSRHDTGDNILPVADLAVEIPLFGQHLPRYKIDQLAIDRCRADIHGNGIIAIGRVAGLHIDDMRLAPGLHRAC